MIYWHKMFVFILPITILLYSTSCKQSQSKPLRNADSLPIEEKEKALNLRFTKGISSIFEDSKGNYWLGSNEEGVCFFDGKSLEYLTTDEGLADNQVRSIQEDKNGTIWLRTARGLSSYDGTNITNHTPITNDDAPSEWQKKAHDLWFNAGNEEGVYRYDGQQLHYLAFPSPKVINPNNVYFVTALAMGKDNMLWIGTYAGIFGYNGHQFTIINDESFELKKEAGLLHIRSILEDSKGRLWIGNNGIGVLLREKGTITNFSDTHHLIHPTSTRSGAPSKTGTLEHVFAIEEDGKGNIWFGDRDTGVWKYDGKTIKNIITKLGSSNDFVHTIYKDKSGELWFLLTNGSLFKLHGNTFQKQF